jgi:hypothetical protein
MQETAWEFIKDDPSGVFDYDEVADYLDTDVRSAGRILENLSRKRHLKATLIDSQGREWKYD